MLNKDIVLRLSPGDILIYEANNYQYWWKIHKIIKRNNKYEITATFVKWISSKDHYDSSGSTFYGKENVFYFEDNFYQLKSIKFNLKSKIEKILYL